MEYHGKLYGKFGNKYFDTGKTSKDFDKLERDNKKMLEMLNSIVENYKSGNEDNFIMANLIDKSEKLIKEATEI
jgi:hypothetical protein